MQSIWMLSLISLLASISFFIPEMILFILGKSKGYQIIAIVFGALLFTCNIALMIPMFDGMRGDSALVAPAVMVAFAMVFSSALVVFGSIGISRVSNKRAKLIGKA